MPLSSPGLRRFVHRALVDEAGMASPDRKQLVGAFNGLCSRLSGRLRPLFGSAAIAALFARALHVGSQEYPWLEHVIAKDSDHCSEAALRKLHPAITTETLHDGFATVLANDIALLTTLIGDDFVMPLVQQAWGSGPPGGARTETDI